MHERNDKLYNSGHTISNTMLKNSSINIHKQLNMVLHIPILSELFNGFEGRETSTSQFVRYSFWQSEYGTES